MQAWILIGMMGAGKSTIGKLLAQETGRRFIDTDHLIEKRVGRPIAQFFKLYGEEAFRDHETAVIESLEPASIVVATGGGAILRDANFNHLRKIGKVIYLKSEPAELIERLQMSKKKRPLLHTDDWEQRIVDLLESRKDRYESADFVIEVDQTDQNSIVEEIVRLMSDQE
ncbi:MAG: AAA family ATPase [Armatimonadetes bacterium]|nr:AAA family ATPase [Armatimonadota bacterium]